MQHYAAFHLGLHCLPKYTFRGFQYNPFMPNRTFNNYYFNSVRIFFYWYSLRGVADKKIQITLVASFGFLKANTAKPYKIPHSVSYFGCFEVKKQPVLFTMSVESPIQMLTRKVHCLTSVKSDCKSMLL